MIVSLCQQIKGGGNSVTTAKIKMNIPQIELEKIHAQSASYQMAKQQNELHFILKRAQIKKGGFMSVDGFCDYDLMYPGNAKEQLELEIGFEPISTIYFKLYYPLPNGGICKCYIPQDVFEKLPRKWSDFKKYIKENPIL